MNFVLIIVFMQNNKRRSFMQSHKLRRRDEIRHIILLDQLSTTQFVIIATLDQVRDKI